MAYIQYGSSGEDVTKLQKQLMDLGYDVGATGADGIFLEKTKAALRSYQADQGLNSNGIVDENTYEALYGTFMPAEMREPTPTKPAAPAKTPAASAPAQTAPAAPAQTAPAAPAQSEPADTGYSNAGALLIKQHLEEQAKQAQTPEQKQPAVQDPVESEDPGTEQYEQMLSKLESLYSQNGAYAQALEAQKAANQAAVEKAVGSLEEQKTSTNRSYADLFRQLYVDRMRNQKNLGQRMAAQGVTGGAAESTVLGLGTSYEEALRKGEQERIGTIGDLDKAITDARLTGDITNAEAAAANAKERANSYASVLQSLISRGDSLDARKAQQIASENEAARAYAYQTAMQILQGGNMVSSDLLDKAGIGIADAQAIVAQAQEAKRLQESERQNTSPVYSTEQVQLALSAAANGDRSEAVKQIVEGYYGLPLDTVLGAYGMPQGTINEEKIAEAAAVYRSNNPNVALDSRTLDLWLNENGYTGEAAQLFKAYLEEFGAGYSRR